MPLRAFASRLVRSAAVLTALVTVAACSSAAPPAAPSTTTTRPAAMVTPLIGSSTADPIPVPATDGKTHIAYELLVTNTLPGDVTLDSLTALDGDRKLLTLAGPNLTYWTRALGNLSTPTNRIASGGSALIWLDVTVDGGVQAPAEIDHSITLTVAKPIPGLVKANLTQTVAPVQVQNNKKPVSIAPPLDGPNWLDGNSCCDTTAHRMAANPINGKIYLAERFAIDYVQLTSDFRLFNGDPTKLESYPYFGAPIHAVADGKVVAVLDNLPEQVATKAPTGLPLDQYAGNHIVQDIGDGNFALYAHLKTGTITVKPGDDLKSGQQIAALGNTGNTDSPHLHFHVMDGPDPLASNGLPFVINRFRLDQRVLSQPSLDTLFTGQPAPLQPGFAAREQSEVSPLVLDIMNYAVGQ